VAIRSSWRDSKDTLGALAGEVSASRLGAASMFESRAREAVIQTAGAGVDRRFQLI